MGMDHLLGGCNGVADNDVVVGFIFGMECGTAPPDAELGVAGGGVDGNCDGMDVAG